MRRGWRDHVDERRVCPGRVTSPHWSAVTPFIPDVVAPAAPPDEAAVCPRRGSGPHPATLRRGGHCRDAELVIFRSHCRGAAAQDRPSNANLLKLMVASGS